jgi:hypothetical protein
MLGVSRAGSLKTVETNLTKYKSYLLALQEVRWDNNGCEPEDNFTVFYGNGNTYQHLQTGISMHKEIRSAVKRVQFLNGRCM